jgi:hypothetical protein
MHDTSTTPSTVAEILSKLKRARTEGSFTYRQYDAFSHTYFDAHDGASGLGEAGLASFDGPEQANEPLENFSKFDTFWRTLTMDVVDCSNIKKHRRCTPDDKKRVTEWMSWILECGQQDSIPQLHWHLNVNLQGKRMVVTKQGYVGLVPKEAQIGDKIYALSGEGYPYVVRPKPGGTRPDSVELVGPSYLHQVERTSLEFSRLHIA